MSVYHPLNRRSAACLLNGWHPQSMPSQPDGGLRSGVVGFQWGDYGQRNKVAPDGTLFPEGSSERIKKIKSFNAGFQYKPSIRFIGILSTSQTWYGMFFVGAYPWWLISSSDNLWINSRWPGQDLGVTTPYPSWPADKEFIPTTKVEVIYGYGERYDQNFNQIGWSRRIVTIKIEGAPYNSNASGYWPTIEYGDLEEKPMEWSPSDEGFEEMDNNYSDGPEFKWYFKDTGEDIGADKVNPISGVGGGNYGSFYARDDADAAAYFDLPDDAIGVSMTYAYKPDKNADTGPYNWHRQDLKLDVYAIIEEADDCLIERKCWYEDASFTVKVTYMEGTAEMDRELYTYSRPYPSFDGGSDNYWSQSSQLGDPSPIPNLNIGGTHFKIGTMEWKDLSPGTYKRITDFSVSLD